MKPIPYLIIFSFACTTLAEAQTEFELELQWKEETLVFENGDETFEVPSFWGAGHSESNGFAPMLTAKFPLGKGQRAVSVNVVAEQLAQTNTKASNFLRREACPEPGYFSWRVGEERGEAVLLIEYFPFSGSKAGNVAMVTKAKINVSKAPALAQYVQKSGFVSNSVLSEGTWYRIGVLNDGIHRIDRNFLQSIGVNTNDLNPQTLNIFGNGYGQLPFKNSVARPDDLVLNNVHIEGESDGSFDEGDYILFFGRGPHTWNYNEDEGLFDHNKHDYCDTSYYFIGINTSAAPARVNTMAASAVAANYVVDTFNDFAFHEVDRENVLKSGREWYGEKFDVQTTFAFGGSQFTFPNILPDTETVVRASVLSRRTSGFGNASFILNVNGTSNVIELGNTGNTSTSAFGTNGDFSVNIIGAPAALNLTFTYEKANTPSAAGWLNWFNINTRRSLRMSGSQMLFRDVQSVAAGRVSRFDIENTGAPLEVWEITDPSNIRRMSLNTAGEVTSFSLGTDQLREFIGFSGGSFLNPIAAGKVQNQNIHSLGLDGPIDMVILVPAQLSAQAEDLANIHRTYDAEPLNVAVVKLHHVYNEFSSGMRDITAIKWLMKMLYDRAGGNESMMPRYLLLFGDGSFDNRNTTPGNTNLVPTYQSPNSLQPANSYVSDDYFGFLGDDEDESQFDVMDVGVGRLTVKNAQEAISVVNKIRRYMEAEGSFNDNCTTCNDAGGSYGSWRNIISFVADDEDNNSHMRNSQTISSRINSYTKNYNIERIYLDAFQQIATPGGARYPDANQTIDRRVRNGAFIVNYIGHGGVNGWAQERILDVPTILDWSNQFAMPVFMTATCEFTRFDDPLRTSAGEYVLLNGNGGGIALMTTTRLVWSGPNFALSERFYDALFDRPPGEVVTRLGDVSRITKNNSLTSGSSNHRNFSLIGDPALPLAIPKNQVAITAITDTLGNAVDTLKALGVIRVTGEVRSPTGSLLGGFNGRLNSTVYDRQKDVTTQANDDDPAFEFRQQEDVVFRGNAEVINGKFSFDFVIPKDISFAVDSTARISLYAFSEDEDGSGYIDKLNIGDRDPNAVDDGTGPEVSLFLNDENFVFGGFTNDTPTLIAEIFDNSGVNTVGTGIGHDITATLDNDPNQTFLLNDFYESNLNTYKSGRVVYQFDKLEPGNHEISFKVWNVHNRSSEEKTSFIVADSEEFAIERVLNYPNPFTTRTSFFFEHNQSCAFLNVMIQVYTVSGKLVKSIVTVSNTDGFRNEPILWDGRDDYGDRLATGVYVYKVSVRNPAGEQVQKFEKLVILN
jgi:hypothetical protein